MLTRRALTALGAMSLTASCAAARGFGEGLNQDFGAAPRERLGLAPVLVAADRVIRIDVGLRPFRPAGFRVAREALGEKTLVHNYGHGGGGVTLSWGTAALAVDLGYDPGRPDCAVLGAGAVGLATARLLQERGARVRIYARETGPNTTSNVAGAQWWPSFVYDHNVATPEFMLQHSAAAGFAYRRFQSLTGADYGVRWARNFAIGDRPQTNEPAPNGNPMREFAPEVRDLTPGEHPFKARFVRQFDTMQISTPHYLRAVTEDVLSAGGEIAVRQFRDPSELIALPERTIFNCTGLGAGLLFKDDAIMPMRGQLVVLLPQPEVDYNVLAGGAYMFSRLDGIVLGGTFERGVSSLEPDPLAIARILQRHSAIFGAMRR